MINDITVISQIADQITLYVNCFKEGYKKLCYFHNPNNIIEIDLDMPEISIRNLQEEEYYFYCENEEGEETGHITVPISTVSIKDTWKNILTESELENKRNQTLIASLSSYDYIMDLYTASLREQQEVDEFDELILAAVSFYNLRQESLNTTFAPEFSIKNNIFSSTNSKEYKFVPFLYNRDNKKWEIINGLSKDKTDKFVFSDKPSEMYLILVLSDFSVIRKYFYYQPSETLSETILERRISTTRQFTEKTVEMMSRFDLSEIKDDEEKQRITCALQELKPEYPILASPKIIYDNESHLFTVEFPDWGILSTVDKIIYLSACEIDEAFNEKRVPHKILVTAENFVVGPFTLGLNYEEDYIFYFSDKSGKPLSNPILCSYGTSTDLETCFSISRRIDIEEYRRRLYNVFREYDKKDWNAVSILLDRYSTNEDNLYRPIMDYMLEAISRLDIMHYRIEYLMQLVLLNQLRNYVPIDQSFINQQVYAEGYHKHVFPEYETNYVIKCGRLNKNAIEWEYISCGEEVQELSTNRDSFLIMQVFDKDLTKASPYAFYHNIYTGETRYFFYPDLEVTVAHGLY